MQNTIPALYDVYLDKILMSAHGTEVPETLLQEMKQDLYGRLQNHLLVCYMQAIPDDQSEALHELVAGNPNEEEVQKFFEAHIPNHETVVADALLEFRDVYVGSIK